MQLRACPVGSEVVIVALGLPETTQLRMGELGLRRGTRIRVTHRAPLGGRVVAIGGARLAIDATTAAGVQVRSVP
ncbi:MAG TPA: FeoA family protein [Actinotalea sp.]|nr:FeoA family protein [Actinotalea sp.]